MSIENQRLWLQSDLGAYLREHEQGVFDQLVTDVFGFNAMQIGLLDMDLLRNCRIPFAFRTDTFGGNVHSAAEFLPIRENCMDLVLLPHALEFSQNPHQVLREVERVLVPEGHVVISGFNPLSLWGIKRLFSKHGDYPWNGDFLSQPRMKDWLALLGFEVVAWHMACFVPPFRNPGWRKRFACLDRAGSNKWQMLGGVYFVIAKKRVLGMRLIKPNWNKAKLKPNLVPAPTQKSEPQKKSNER
jgi:SAM-dependent methyltransferase